MNNINPFKKQINMYRPYGCGPWGAWRQHHSFAPPVNIEETDSSYTLFVYAPSLTRENISVVTENVVNTSADLNVHSI
jgi:HSP20 family molecular chaperone IbpA